ncbi:hypothetical protein I6F35_19435 [Bradyrhizobium sp. BRP22]|uniref:hypothetical protein n=1 Tax=Bradyrhizobium sp. BRP22 TaxID=2793821 RepID=UPI001CD59817|nr:hypothetical protein [Bradyrhizobium sp. BRP22]MCA1455363.1 hypothetical protein [Bradyrhizobium sp. BRP22]
MIEMTRVENAASVGIGRSHGRETLSRARDCEADTAQRSRLKDTLNQHRVLITTFAGLVLAAVAQCIYVVADLMPTWPLMSNNSDVLFVEDIARDLNGGGRLFDWRLSQVTYIFPDILIARLLAYLGAGATKISVLFQALFPVVLLPLVFALAKGCRADARAATIFAGFIYLLTYTGELDRDFIAVHFGLIGFHTGALIPAIAAICFAGLLVRVDGPSSVGIAGVFVSLFLGLISDSLVGAITLPPLAIWLLLLWRRRPEKRRHVLAAATAILLAVIFGRIFSILNPFPQDREYLAAAFAAMPHSSFQSIRVFVTDLATYTATSKVSAALLLLTLASFGLSLRHLLFSRGINMSTLLALTVVISTPAVIALDLILGIYVSIASSRHWAPAVYLAIVSGPIILSIDRRSALVPAVVLASGLLLSGQFVVGMAGSRGKLPAENVFAGFAACMEQQRLPQGWLYISDYWMARPVRMLSHGRFGLVPYLDGVFSNQSNLRWIRSATPRYAIAGFGLAESNLVHRYGPPRATFCDMQLGNGATVKVLDYSDNEDFKTSIRREVVAAY